LEVVAMSHLHGCKQTPDTPPTTTDEESSGSTDDGDMKKKKGNRAMGKKKYPKAIKYYSKAIKIDPENPTYRLNRAIANSALELWKDAEADASCAVELGDPPSVKSHYWLAKSRLRRGHIGEAKSALDDGLSAYPGESALAQLAKDIEKSQLEREQRAQRKLEENRKQASTSNRPDGTRTVVDQARALLAEGKVEEAVARLREITETQATGDAVRDQISAWSLLGKAHMQVKNWADAAEAFGKLVELEEATFSKNNKEEREALSNAYNNRGIAFKNAGQMQQAVQSLNSAYMQATNGDDKVATPQAAQILQNLAQCLRAQKRPIDAQRMYERALEVSHRLYGDDHASHALNHLCIARCLRDQGLIPDAIKQYVKAIQIWSEKDDKECLREMPEVPNAARLAEIREQCKIELAQLVTLMEQAKRIATSQSGDATTDDARAQGPVAQDVTEVA